jgi:hypothetical protein
MPDACLGLWPLTTTHGTGGTPLVLNSDLALFWAIWGLYWELYSRRGCPPGRLARPCPGGAPIEKNGPFRWAVEGFWGLQTGCGVEKRPSR